MWWLVATSAMAQTAAEGHRLEVVAHGGGATYAPFAFVTFGAEVGVRTVSGVFVVAGVDVWGTNRILPPELQLDTGIYNQWNWMQPLHLGAVFKLEVGPIEAYAGADALACNYYRDADGAAWAFGGRARLGADWYFLDNLAVEVDLAPGVWSGGAWPDIDDRARSLGPVLTGSAGIKFGI
ncbi:MAG: hypothetical protein H6738_01330 [Alphaproteobacteria bacterium]|nr:hypothetical protein [Alphaproteobacteria bacterium]MCB9695409.1 hypothetical protein [Alphaproteobacteria bacterium]